MSAGESNRVSTGIPGLDSVLHGGLTPRRVCLIEGTPGAGKTTLGLQFLLAGLKQNEKVMYITLSETAEELRSGAASHDMDLTGMEFLELLASEEELNPDNQLSMYQPWEMELGKTMKTMLTQIELHKPTRIVIDSLSELRLQSQSALRFRRQVLSLKQFFLGLNCTVLLLDDKSIDSNSMQLQSITHGVLVLEQLSPEYGSARRRLKITKLRGQSYRGGYHDFVIARGGLVVFPRLIAAEHEAPIPRSDQQLSSGLPELDTLLGGGVAYGSSILLTGPAGSGKSTLIFQYVKAALDRGEAVAVFSFDERRESIIQRATSIGLDVDAAIEANHLSIQQIDPGELSPGQFCSLVRTAVEVRKSTLVVIDSLNGYLASMPEERYLTIQMHELLTYLGHRGVVTFLVVAQHGLLGSSMQTPIDTTYLADAVILLRYFEVEGSVKRAISVMKKRDGVHEKTIREFSIDMRGFRIGNPLKEFHGVLTGTPRYIGASKPLLENRPENE